MWSSIQVLPNQVSKNLSKRLKILVPCKVKKKTKNQQQQKDSETLGADSI